MKKLPKYLIEYLNDLKQPNTAYSYANVIAYICQKVPFEYREEMESRFHEIHEKRQKARRMQRIKALSK